MFSGELKEQAVNFLAAMRARGYTFASAESCTGGLIVAHLTDIAGSSDVVDRGFVTYSNDSKSRMVDVPASLIDLHGAVSREVALAMAEGALERSAADITVAVTGVAGPGGGSSAKPVGLVHIAAASKSTATMHLECRFGALERSEIRTLTVAEALRLATEMLKRS